MKHLKGLFTALLLLCCIGTAKAEEVTIDGIKYDVVTKAKLATVISGGNYSGDIVIPNEITYNDVIYSVTSIGNEAFYNCQGLTSITIPNSVTSIGYRAFYFCNGLTGELVIPNSVTSIGNEAFYYCDGLTGELVIPNSVTSIGYRAFPYCSGLTSIEIPNSVTSIGEYAFYGCYGLTSIEIPNSVTSIGEYAFYKCTGLKTVYNLSNLTFSKGSTSYGHIAYYADKLYNMPNGSIEGNFIFGKPNGVNSLLYYLGNETELTLPADYKGENYAIGADAFNCNSTITTIEIPNSVTSIGEKAFIWCSRLTSIEIPNSVTSIGNQAFQYCSSLTNVVIGNSVTSIGSEVFYGCHGLTSVTIGSGVRYIDWKAFAKCENLADVYCHATTVPSTNNNAFSESYPKYTTLHVPAEAINSYKTTAPWSSFGTIMAIDDVEVPVCATPVISYSNGKLSFKCETEGAEFVTEITSSDFNKFYSNSIGLSATYSINVYATATGYEKSETVNATLCWIECDCDADDTGIINIPAKAALVTSNGGVLSISCQLDGEEVAVYTTDGVLIGTTTIENGTAIVATGLSKGSVAIVNIADKSIKILVD